LFYALPAHAVIIILIGHIKHIKLYVENFFFSSWNSRWLFSNWYSLIYAYFYSKFISLINKNKMSSLVFIFGVKKRISVLF
jgi:hypothetical protein